MEWSKPGLCLSSQILCFSWSPSENFMPWCSWSCFPCCVCVSVSVFVFECVSVCVWREAGLTSVSPQRLGSSLPRAPPAPPLTLRSITSHLIHDTCWFSDRVRSFIEFKSAWAVCVVLCVESRLRSISRPNVLYYQGDASCDSVCCLIFLCSCVCICVCVCDCLRVCKYV